MTPRELELQPLCDAVNLIIEPQRLLLVCLTAANPDGTCTIAYAPLDEAGGKVPESFKDRAMALYGIVGRELENPNRSRCVKSSRFPGHGDDGAELAAFKIKNPMKYRFGT